MQHLINTLTKADAKRLAKATAALAEDAITISATYRTDKEIRAEVTNGDKVTYAVVLTADRAFCGCKDSLHRIGKPCSKSNPAILYSCYHGLALAVWGLQHQDATEQATDEEKAEEPTAIHLCRPDETTWCGREKTKKSWAFGQWPEREYFKSFGQVCQTCEAIVFMPKNALNGARNTAQSEASAIA